ncbi:hypothetical protein Gotri_024944 [Gossypium trilobum]|uniref:Uncharacterized protein n=1 Tax=Gossypium trilobum TaxID=34281 RepID=A0A7J9FHG9_9ROSI|nr:hypothetical protein [Gossypium trilobum]
MTLVVDKDMAIGSFAKTFVDIDLDKVSLMNKLNLWVNNLAKLLMLWNNLLSIRNHIFTKK